MAALFGLLIGVGLVLLIMSGIWWLWCAVVPVLWPTGPEQLINPSYWLFVGAWLLASLVGRAIFGRSSKD